MIEDASTFRVARQIKRHVGFRHALHHCLGAALARHEVRVVVEELLRRSPGYEIDVDAVRWTRSPVTRGPAYLPIRA